MTEAVEVGRRLEVFERKLADQRRREGNSKGGGDRKSAEAREKSVGGNFPPTDPEPTQADPRPATGRSAGRVGAAVGMSGRTYLKAKAVVAAAEEDPEAFTVPVIGEKAFDLMTVAPGTDVGGRPRKGEETGITVIPVSGEMSDPKAKRLRAILRAPEVVQELYREGLVTQAVAMNDGAEIKLRAERRMGELLAEMPGKGRHGGDRKSSSTVELDSLGITKQDSHRWQRVAGVPGEDFEGHVAAVSVWTSWPTP